jgi:hypothetical protein
MARCLALGRLSIGLVARSPHPQPSPEERGSCVIVGFGLTADQPQLLAISGYWSPLERIRAFEIAWLHGPLTPTLSRGEMELRY